MQEIILNVESKEIRYAFLKHGILHELVIERKKSRQMAGNIYRGRVTNILQNIQSAFIDIGEGENGFIHISDIVENTQKFRELYELDFDDEETPQRETKSQDIAALMKPDQPVMVQIVKEPMGSKGARLTSNVSIAGRYLVLLPNTSHRGVSRKIEDVSARDRLKKLIQSFEMPHDMGLICRTASVKAPSEALIEEAHELFSTWQSIVEKFQKSTRPALLFQESDLIRRALITAVDKKVDRLLIDDYATYQTCKRLYTQYSAEHPIKIEFYRDKTPMFERFNVEREIEKALRRKIWLPSGGYLFFDRTEAMYTIDVNSGRSSSQKSFGDLEEALVHINIEAAEEIARQLRLRNIGGLIICDFIDMRTKKSQKRVLDHFKEAMKDDGAKCTVLGMSEFGLVEMTRQRSRESLMQTMFTHCPYCSGLGMIKSHETVSIEIERALKRILAQEQHFALRLECHPELTEYLLSHDKENLFDLSEAQHAKLVFDSNDNLHINDFLFYSTINGKRIEI